MKKAFSPEFRNRFTAIFRFNELGKETLALILEKELRNLNHNLAEKQMVVSITPEAKEFLIEKAFAEKMGGRPIERLVQTMITEKIVDRILFEENPGATILFDKVGDELQIV